MTIPSGGGTHPVEALLHSLAVGLSSLSLHGSDDPEVGKALDRVRLAFGPVWSMGPHLTLSVCEDGFAWKGEAFPDASGQAAIGIRLHRAGVTDVEFTPGVEAEEIVSFLETLHRAEALEPEDEDDLTTLLWRQDFHHLHYTLTETVPEGVTPIAPAEREGPGTAPEVVRAKLKEDVATADRTSGLVKIEKFDSTLYFLDQIEVDYLRDAIEREYSQDHATNVVGLLLDTFELQTDSDVRKEVLSVLDELLPHLLGSRNFGASAYLVSEIRAVRNQGSGLTTRQIRALDRLVSRLSAPEALAQLFHTLQDAEEIPSADDLAGFLDHLGPDAVETLLIWPSRLSSQEGREALTSALFRYLQLHPGSLSKALASDDSGVALRALEMVRRFKLEPGAEALSALASHSNAGVRAAVVPVLAGTREPAAVRHLARMITDPDPEVRIGVLRAFSARPYQGAISPLEGIIEGNDLEEMDLGEKRVLFETYGKLAGQGGVPLLTSLLRAKSRFGKRRPSSDTRACAALALGRIGTPSARQILEKALRDRDPVVRNSVSRALK